jgi:hypothetical protein
VDEVFA